MELPVILTSILLEKGSWIHPENKYEYIFNPNSENKNEGILTILKENIKIYDETYYLESDGIYCYITFAETKYKILNITIKKNGFLSLEHIRGPLLILKTSPEQFKL